MNPKMMMRKKRRRRSRSFSGQSVPLDPRAPCPFLFKVSDLRRIVAERSHLSIQNLKLVYRGNVLHDTKGGDDAHVEFTEGDSLIVAVKPKAPIRQCRDGVDSDDEDDLKFQLPQTASWWKRKLFHLLHDKLKLPDILLMAIFSLEDMGSYYLVVFHGASCPQMGCRTFIYSSDRVLYNPA